MEMFVRVKGGGIPGVFVLGTTMLDVKMPGLLQPGTVVLRLACQPAAPDGVANVEHAVTLGSAALRHLQLGQLS